MVGVVDVKNVDFPYENRVLQGRKVHPLIYNAIGKSRFSPMKNAKFPSENTALLLSHFARATHNTCTFPSENSNFSL
jgi:hypothetical protein